MSWLDGVTKNWADLSEADPDPGLRPVVLPVGPAAAVAWAASRIAAAGSKRWSVVAADPAGGTLHATHATRLWGFIDDVNLRFEAAATGSRMTAESRSRVGKGDFGQNARNLRELTDLLRTAMTAPGAPGGGPAQDR